jgi:hypothetical protein
VFDETRARAKWDGSVAGRPATRDKKGTACLPLRENAEPEKQGERKKRGKRDEAQKERAQKERAQSPCGVCAL